LKKDSFNQFMEIEEQFLLEMDELELNLEVHQSASER
jgi:hypothetical protein